MCLLCVLLGSFQSVGEWRDAFIEEEYSFKMKWEDIFFENILIWSKLQKGQMLKEQIMRPISIQSNCEEYEFEENAQIISLLLSWKNSEDEEKGSWEFAWKKATWNWLGDGETPKNNIQSKFIAIFSKEIWERLRNYE